MNGSILASRVAGREPCSMLDTIVARRSEGGLIREVELLANVRVRMGYRQDGPPPARTPQESGIGQHGGWGTNSDG